MSFFFHARRVRALSSECHRRSWGRAREKRLRRHISTLFFDERAQRNLISLCKCARSSLSRARKSASERIKYIYILRGVSVIKQKARARVIGIRNEQRLWYSLDRGKLYYSFVSICRMRSFFECALRWRFMTVLR